MKEIKKKDQEDSDNESTDRTTCEDVQADKSTTISRERKGLPEADDSRRRCQGIQWVEVPKGGSHLRGI